MFRRRGRGCVHKPFKKHKGHKGHKGKLLNQPLFPFVSVVPFVFKSFLVNFVRVYLSNTTNNLVANRDGNRFRIVSTDFTTAYIPVGYNCGPEYPPEAA